MRQTRRRLLGTMGIALAAPRLARGQAATLQIGFLDPSPSDTTRQRVQSFRDAMRALGYQEGRGYVLQYRSAEGDFGRLPSLANELVQLPVRVLVARNTPGISAARAVTASIPIVMAEVGEPLALGFVRSLSKPGVNITGVSNSTIELLRKRLDVLKEVVPGLRRVAVLGNSADPNTPLQLAEVAQAANALRLETRVFDARSLEALPGVLAEAAAWKPHGALPLVHPLRPAMTPAIVQWSARSRIPTIFATDGDAQAGGLMSYAADLSDHYVRVAGYVDRLLKGANAAELPIERPTRVLLVVNLSTARAMGVRIPQAVLARADRVIE